MEAVAEKQHMVALKLANEIRSDRARMKERINSGELTAQEVLTEGVPTCLRSATVFDFFRWHNRVGRERANKMCVDLRIGPSRKLGDLTQRQRLEVILSVSGR